MNSGEPFPRDANLPLRAHAPALPASGAAEEPSPLFVPYRRTWYGFFVRGETIEQRMLAFRNTSGFDYLRLLLAISVLVVHSVAIAHGEKTEMALVWSWPASGPARSILCMFFALSGFLVAGSVFRTDTILSFIGLRALRLLPALAVETTLSAVFLGAWLTKLPLSYYFLTHGFWRYFLNIIGHIQYHLPGVFFTNPVRYIVNNSLWTIPAELDCYFILVIAMLTGFIRRRTAIFYITLYLNLALYGYEHMQGLSNDFKTVGAQTLVGCFGWGVTFYLYRERIRLSAWLALLATIIGISLLYCREAASLSAPFITYVTIWLGLFNPKRIPVLMGGDYSYGIYLYAYPIQQAVSCLLPQMRTCWFNILISLPAAALCACFSWHCIEKQVLRYKRVVASSDGFLAQLEHRLVRIFRSGFASVQSVATAGPVAQAEAEVNTERI